jgi:hypothetical protein
MDNRKKILSLLLGASVFAMVGVTAVQSQMIVGTQDFSITVEQQADITPDAFVFASVLDSEPNTLVTSALTTISGIDEPVPVSVTGTGSPEISLDEGLTWATEGVITNGGTILVRLTSGPLFYSGSTFNTTRQAIVTVGDLDGSFLVRNRAGNTVPEAFAFATGTGAAPNTLVTSDPVTITGLEMGSPVSVSGSGSPQISIAGGAWSDTGTVENGQAVRVRFTTPRLYEAVSSATVTVGGVQSTWSVATADCVTGDLFNLELGDSTCYGNRDVVNAGPGLIAVGTTGTDYISWAAANSLCLGYGAEWGLPPAETMTGTGSINVNRSIPGIEAVLNESNSSTYWTSTPTQTVSLGSLPLVYTGVNTTASVICMTQPWLTDQFVASDYVPDPFTIAPTSGSPDTFLMSEPVVISGLEPGKSVFLRVSSASTNGAPTFSVNGGSYEGTERLVTNGDTVRFGIKSAIFNGASLTVSAETRDPAGTVNRSTIWSVTSVAGPTESVDSFAFNWQYFPQTYFGTFPGDIYESEIITLTGGTGTRPLQLLNSSGNYNSGTLNRWPALYGTRIYYLSTGTNATTSLTNDNNRVFWSTLSSNYPNIVTDMGREIRLKYAPANGSNETYTVLCVASTCSEHIWTNSSTRSDPRAANPFDVADVTGASLETEYTSEPFTVSWAARTAGVQAPNIPISISGTGSPQYRINGGSWTNVAGWVGAGSTVEVRLTSAATAGTDHTATLSVGTTTSDYVVRTLDDTTPDAFALVAVSSAAPNAQITSAPVTISGITTSVPVNITGEGSPQFSTDAGATWVTTGMVGPNGSVLVRLTSASAYEAVRTATLDVNGETSSWTVTTAPFTFAVSGKTDVLLNALTVSDPVTMPAYLTASAISVSGGGSPEYSINGGAFTSASGTISAGQVLRVRLTAASTKDAELVANVTIGSATAAFSVRTAPPEACETGSIGSICSDGAIYAGTVNGNKIFAAPSSVNSVTLKTTATATIGSLSNDGLVNMEATRLAGLAAHPAANACAALGSEWVLPSFPELQAMYNNRASAPAGTYILSGSTASRYWSSTELGSDGRRGQYLVFSSGSASDTTKTTSYNAHCIRYSREEPRTYTDPCASGTQAIGTMCSDGAIYAGTASGKQIFFDPIRSANLRWKTTDTYTPGASSTTDAVQNRLAMEMNGGLAIHPAQNFCASKGVSASGSVWYLPSSNDLAILSANRNTGSLRQMFEILSGDVWSSTQSTEYPDDATEMYDSGTQSTSGTKSSATEAGVICMRYNAPQTYTDPCSGTPSVGQFCADGTVYAGTYGGNQLRVTTLLGTFAQKTANTTTVGTVSTDGLLNTQAMVAAGLSSHPAANACRALGPNFYLPSSAEFSALRSGTAGVAQTFTDYWTSNELIDGDGDQGVYWRTNNTSSSSSTKTSLKNVLCVSNGPARTPADPCDGASPTPGSLCSDGSVYYASIDGRKLFTSQTDRGNFQLSTSTAANAATTNLRDGRVNMAGMVGTAYPAANACRALGTGWYLPARDELALLATNANGLVLEPTFGSTGDYWSSTQNTTTSRNWEVDLTGGSQGGTSKSSTLRVRCIRTE